jgi:hypothetical protein
MFKAKSPGLFSGDRDFSRGRVQGRRTLRAPAMRRIGAWRRAVALALLGALPGVDPAAPGRVKTARRFQHGLAWKAASATDWHGNNKSSTTSQLHCVPVVRRFENPEN